MTTASVTAHVHNETAPLSSITRRRSATCPATTPASAEQRREDQDVGADHDARADVRVVTDERRDRGRDLRRVGRERREHPGK